MATTAVIPTYVVSGAPVVLGFTIPTYTVNNGLAPFTYLPTYTFGSTVNYGALPAYTLNQLSFSLTPSGGTNVGGGALIVGDPYKPIGGSLVSGSATVSGTNVVIANIYPSGGVSMTGAALNSFNYVGGAKLGGTAAVNSLSISITTVLPTGGMSMTGFALISEDIPVKPTGGSLVSGSAQPVFISVHTPAGGMLGSGSAPSMAVYTTTPVGGGVLSGAAIIKDFYPVYTPKGGLSLSGSAIAFMIPVGGVSTTENPYNDIFDAWVINYDTNAASRYERFAANSITSVNGVTYVANAGGIYIMDGDDDAGQPIRASVSLGTTDFGEKNDKKVPDIYFGLRSSQKMKLKVITNLDSEYYYDVNKPNIGSHGSRLEPAKGLKGLSWSFRLDNVNGGSFELDSIIMNVAVSTVRMGR